MAEVPAADPVAGLVDIPLPAPVSLWPQTPASQIAIVVLVASLIAGTWWLVRRRRANRYRRAALRELGAIEARLDTDPQADLSAALAALVRRTALAAFPRAQVASLAGPDWLAFLDRTSDRSDFSQGPGQALEIDAYRLAPADAQRQHALAGLVRQWIRTHHA